MQMRHSLKSGEKGGEKFVRVLHVDGPADARSLATVTAIERASEVHFRLCGRWFGQCCDVDEETIEGSLNQLRVMRVPFGRVRTSLL